jgi:hypothetical protein
VSWKLTGDGDPAIGAKVVGQNQRSMGIAPAAFAQWARSAATGDRAQDY